MAIDTNGMSYVDHLSWEAYNETNDIERHIENYKKVHGHYPEVLLGIRFMAAVKTEKY